MRYENQHHLQNVRFRSNMSKHKHKRDGKRHEYNAERSLPRAQSERVVIEEHDIQEPLFRKRSESVPSGLQHGGSSNENCQRENGTHALNHSIEGQLSKRCGRKIPYDGTTHRGRSSRHGGASSREDKAVRRLTLSTFNVLLPKLRIHTLGQIDFTDAAYFPLSVSQSKFCTQPPVSDRPKHSIHARHKICTAMLGATGNSSNSHNTTQHSAPYLHPRRRGRRPTDRPTDDGDHNHPPSCVLFNSPSR